MPSHASAIVRELRTNDTRNTKPARQSPTPAHVASEAKKTCRLTAGQPKALAKTR
jgi:hypothetical protein